MIDLRYIKAFIATRREWKLHESRSRIKCSSIGCEPSGKALEESINEELIFRTSSKSLPQKEKNSTILRNCIYKGQMSFY